MRDREMFRSGRRRFLKTLAGIGMSGQALAYMSQDTLASITSDPKREVPRLKELRHTNHEAVMQKEEPPEREPIYYTIPRDEWAYVEGVQNAAVGMQQHIDNRLNTCGSTAGYVTAATREAVSGHHTRREVVVQHITINDEAPNPDFQTVKEKLPGTIDGRAKGAEASEAVEDIPVTFEQRDMKFLDGGADGEYDYDYDPNTPVGAEIEAYQRGTTGTAAYHNGRDEFVMTTVNHICDPNNDGSGQYDAYQPDLPSRGGGDQGSFIQGDTIGDGSEMSCDSHVLEFDGATLSFGGNVTYKFAQNDGSYRNQEVAGTLGWDWIVDNQGKSQSKQGTATGWSSGSVNCTNPNTKVYLINASSANGDSGGPIHRQTYYSDGTSFESVGSVLSIGDSSACGGVHISEIESRLNVSV